MTDNNPNGRPRKKKEDQRSETLHVRLTEREYAQVVDDAQSMNMDKAGYVRHRLFGKGNGTRKANPVRAELIKAASLVGSVCSDLRQIIAESKEQQRETNRLLGEVRLKLARIPRYDDPALHDSLGKLADDLSASLEAQRKEPPFMNILTVLQTIMENLMSYLNGNSWKSEG